MKLGICFLIFFGYFIRVSHSKNVHVKIIVPVEKHTHKHTHTIYKTPKEQKKIVIHKHHHKHGHGHKHGHKHGHEHKSNHKHKHDHKHKHKHHQHKDGHGHYSLEEHPIINNWKKDAEVNHFRSAKAFRPSPPAEDTYNGVVPMFNDIHSGYPELESYDDNFEKSIKSESFHFTEAKNSAASDPIGKHFVTGSYKVHEGDPSDITSTKFHKVFQAPLANINHHETSYLPSAPAVNTEGEEEYEEPEYDDVGEEDYEGDDDVVENYDYAESVGVPSNSGTPTNSNAYGIEALKQFFQNNV